MTFMQALDPAGPKLGHPWSSVTRASLYNLASFNWAAVSHLQLKWSELIQLAPISNITLLLENTLLMCLLKMLAGSPVRLKSVESSFPNSWLFHFQMSQFLSTLTLSQGPASVYFLKPYYHLPFPVKVLCIFQSHSENTSAFFTFPPVSPHSFPGLIIVHLMMNGNVPSIKKNILGKGS